jgi:hypothetical protein
MIRLFCFALVCLLSFQACQARKKTPDVSVTEDKTKTTGKVSHEYKSCGTVVVVGDATSNKPQLVLIPNSSLAEFDVEGLEIAFHYRPLKMKNPAGCSMGSPAAFFDITKK